MKVLVLGAQGMLGRDLVPILSTAHEVVGRDLGDFDITDAGAVEREIRSIRPQVVVNAAAYTNVDGCESRRETAFAANAGGPLNIAQACAQIAAKMVHLSTDYVFDGSSPVPYVEGDRPNPLNVYGESKLAGEKGVQSAAPDYVIVRTEWLYGPHGKNFVDTILALTEKQQEIRVVDDQKGSPTFTADLSRAIFELLQIDARGVFHVTNSGCCTWFEFACRILSAGKRNVKITPISSSELGRPARRPPNSVLNCFRFEQATGRKMRSWSEALQEYLAFKFLRCYKS